MLNRPTTIFAQTDRDASKSQRPWQVDQRPVARIIWLFSINAVVFVIIAARMVYVQTCLTAGFVEPFHETSVSFEPIPSRDGRILASNGQVLARDLQQFSVLVHYRWLEEPPNPGWLRQQALARLDRMDRRDRELIAEQEQRILSLRDTLWEGLANVTNTPTEQLQEERGRIQTRVARIIEHVEGRRAERSEKSIASVAPPRQPDMPWWQRTWLAVYTALTTPPSEDHVEPLIVKEELDYHPLLENVTLEAAAAIESHPELFPGTRISVTTSRTYPQGELASHVVGTRVSIRDDELATRKERYPDGDPLDYKPDDRIGQTGVERTCDSLLRGSRGLRKITKNRRGEVIDTETVHDPRIGQDIVLTLDLPLQQETEKLLDDVVQGPRASEGIAKGGVIFVMDVRTGEVLVAAQAPRFDLNLLSDPDGDKWKQAVLDPRNLFFPRITQMALPPGSVFKTLSAIAFMESGKFDPQEPVECIGYLHTPDKHRCYVYRHWGHGHGAVTLRDAITQSCNVYFYAVAERLGAEPLVEWGTRLGFGSPTGIDLPGEVSGNLPAPNRPGSTWYRGDTLGLAIGQSRLTVTPLQIVRLMAAVSNGGYLVTPHVLQPLSPAPSYSSDGSSDPTVGTRYGQRQRIPGLRPQTLAIVREGLERVISDSHGTGYRYVRLKNIAIAGKTGTAEVGGGRNDHAWFAGYVPADKPRYAFVVVLENAGSGGKSAGPVAQRLVQAMFNKGLLPDSSVLAESGGG